jgi:hypothetical protein
MNMNYDLARTEIATRLQHAKNRRTAKDARTQRRPDLPPRWQRSRWT